MDPIQQKSSKAKMPIRTVILIGMLGAVAAAYAFVPHHPKEHTPTLEERLHGDPEDAQQALSEITSGMTHAQAEALLIKDANDPNPSLRFAAVDALSNYHDSQSLSVLKSSFSDSSADIRESALYSVVQVDKPDGNKMLVSALKDQDTQVREEAITIIETNHDPKLVPVLIQALNDPDPSVVSLATGALRSITKQPYLIKSKMPDDQRAKMIEKWNAWWSANKSSWGDSELQTVAQTAPTRLDPAPDFNLIDTGGNNVSLTGQHGKLTLLNFWGTWCPPCQEEIPDLVKIDHDYRSKGVDVIGIATDEPSENVLTDYCMGHGVMYRVAMAPNSVLESYGNIDEVPVTVLIDRNGKIRYRWDGPRDYNTFKNAIETVMKG
jgi:peroxiredoxin